MKYDILEPFKEYLKENLSPNTAKTYYGAVVKLFKDSQFDSLGQIDKEWIEQEAAKRFTTRNEYSAVKNGLKWLKKYNPDLALPSEKEFSAVSIRKRNFSRKPKKVIYLKPTQRKINQISNDRLRYAYRLALVSGLRVSELADLEADDITFNDGKIFVRVKNGKGGHGGLVECRDDAYLYERLPEFLKKYTEGKIFYSESYMREKADELGIECHDLRRIFAQTTREELKKEMPVAAANEIVQQRLRHARFSTTKRYLFNRKLKFEYEETDEEPDCVRDEVQKRNETVIDLQEYTVKGVTYKVDEKHVLLDNTEKEKEVAKLISKEFGMQVYVVPRVVYPQKVSTPDYVIGGKKYDLKEPIGSGKNVLYNMVHKKKSQANNFIFDISNCPLDDETIRKQVENLYTSSHTSFIDEIIIVKKGKVKQKYKRKQ